MTAQQEAVAIEVGAATAAQGSAGASLLQQPVQQKHTQQSVLASDDPKPAAAAGGAPAGRWSAAWALVKRWTLWLWDLACEHWFLLGMGFAIGTWHSIALYACSSWAKQ